MWQIINEYVGILIMLIGTFLFGKIILNTPIKIQKKKFLLLFLATSIIQTVTKTNITGTLKTVLIVISNIIFYKYTFKIDSKKATLLSFLQMLVLILPDLLELFLMTEVLNVSKEFYYNEFAGSIACNLIALILFIIITYIIKKILQKIVNAKIENNVKIIFLLILTVVCSIMFFYEIIKDFKINNNITLYLVCIILLVIILFSLIRQTIKNNNLTREYDQLLEFMTTYENEIEKQRVLRHEIKNEFRTIRAKICDKQQNQEIIEYIDEIVNDKYEVKQEKYAKFGYLPPNGIKGLCYFKIQEAENKGIKVSLNISKRIKESSIYELNIKQQRDFGRMLGVFLDNAIEASIESEEKKMGLEAYTNSKNEFKLIISNTYNNEIDTTKIGKESFSSKGKTRGHGLLLVKQLVGNNNIFEIKTDIQDNLYIQTVIIKEIIDDKNL